MSFFNPQELLSGLPETAHINFEAHKERLEGYATAMAPGKPVSVQEGVNFQMQLWNAIKMMLNCEGNEFVLHYSEMLRVIKENRKKAFSERHLYRFMEHVRMTSDDRTNFMRLLNLMLTTCDPQMRALSMRQVDLRTSLAGLRSESQRQKIQAYYSL